MYHPYLEVLFGTYWQSTFAYYYVRGSSKGKKCNFVPSITESLGFVVLLPHSIHLCADSNSLRLSILRLIFLFFLSVEYLENSVGPGCLLIRERKCTVLRGFLRTQPRGTLIINHLFVKIVSPVMERPAVLFLIVLASLVACFLVVQSADRCVSWLTRKLVTVT